MSAGRAQDILIGPRTTVYALLAAYPSLDGFLQGRLRGFERLQDERARTRWARVMTLEDVAMRLNVSWQHLGRDIAGEVERETGRHPRVADAPKRIIDDGRRLTELRGIVAGLEAGAPLPEMAERWRAATADLEPAEKTALEAALSGDAAAGEEAGVRAVRGAAEPAAPVPLPPGHPLDLLRREAELLQRLLSGLAAELDRLGGSPSRRRWQQEKPLVTRLVDRLSGIELRFRREQQAWFPALGVHGVEGPQALLVARQQEALETLRRLRLAVEHDDATSVAEAALRFGSGVDDLLAQDERLLEPLALRHFSTGDWVAVRELEDGVGWALGQPPRWPAA
jgi:DUF438 domain-containing protein